VFFRRIILRLILRVLAHLSEDPALIRAFKEGATFTVQLRGSVSAPLEQVTEEQRSRAKAVNLESSTDSRRLAISGFGHLHAGSSKHDREIF